MSIAKAFSEKRPLSKAMLRWWFPDAGADLMRVRHQVRSFYEAGFGGVEVAMVPEFSEFDAREYGWGTKRWVSIVKTILQAAAELPEHFEVDFTITAHWPPAINTILPNGTGAAKELQMTVTKAKSLRMPMAMPRAKTNDGQCGDPADYIFTDTFVAATLAQVQEVRPDRIVLRWDSLQDVSSAVHTIVDETGAPVWTPAGIPAHETHFGTKPKLADRQYRWEIDLSDLDLPSPQTGPVQEEDWLLFGFYERGTGAVLSGLEMTVLHMNIPMADKMYETDYYSVAGAKILTDFWNETFLSDPEIRCLMEQNGGAIFEDSIEASFGGLAWTPDYLSEFETRRGYDLKKYLPLVASISVMGGKRYVSDPGVSVRVFEDYHHTLNDLYLEGHIKTLQDWAHSFGYQYRAQSYGCGVDTSAAAIFVDVPEGESLGFGANYDYFRNIAGGVHMSGRKLLSEEALADIFRPYDLTWANGVYTLNQNFAAGVNRMIFHGAAYEQESSGKFSQWPGWHAFQFAFADPWGDRMPYWRDTNILTDYLSRTQAVLQGGVPQIDLAVFKVSKEYGLGFEELLNAGYTYDIISHYALKADFAQCRDGLLCPDGPAYQAILVNEKYGLDLGAVEKLGAMADQGLPVIVMDHDVKRVNGLSRELTEKDLSSDAQLRATMEKLLQKEHVFLAKTPEAVLAVLQKLEIRPRLAHCDPEIRTTGRRDADGSQWYFVFNKSHDRRATAYTLCTQNPVYSVSPWSGQAELLTEKTVEKDKNLTICLEGGQCIFLTDSPEAKFLPQGHVLIPETYGEIMPGNWDLSLESWGPDLNGVVPTMSKKTLLELKQLPLGAWSQIPVGEQQLANLGVSKMANVSGRGSYHSSFSWQREWGNRAVLTLEHGADMVTAVLVNGMLQAPVEPSVGKLVLEGLCDGENTLEIEIATTLGHRVKVENPWLKPGQSLRPEMSPPPSMDIPGEDTPHPDMDVPGGDIPMFPPRGIPAGDPDAVFQGDPPPESEVFALYEEYGLTAVKIGITL